MIKILLLSLQSLSIVIKKEKMDLLKFLQCFLNNFFQKIILPVAAEFLHVRVGVSHERILAVNPFDIMLTQAEKRRRAFLFTHAQIAEVAECEGAKRAQPLPAEADVGVGGFFFVHCAVAEKGVASRFQTFARRCENGVFRVKTNRAAERV